MCGQAVPQLSGRSPTENVGYLIRGRHIKRRELSYAEIIQLLRASDASMGDDDERKKRKEWDHFYALLSPSPTDGGRWRSPGPSGCVLSVFGHVFHVTEASPECHQLALHLLQLMPQVACGPSAILTSRCDIFNNRGVS